MEDEACGDDDGAWIEAFLYFVLAAELFISGVEGLVAAVVCGHFEEIELEGHAEAIDAADFEGFLVD